ncbi:unnamed protein product [Brassica rapa subsp. narinosa]
MYRVTVLIGAGDSLGGRNQNLQHLSSKRWEVDSSLSKMD